MAKPFRNDGKPRINDGLKVLLDNLDKIKELASLNLSITKICSCLGITVRAYYYHLDEHPEIQQAVEDGRALGVKKVAESLIKTAQKGKVMLQLRFFTSRMLTLKIGTKKAPQLILMLIFKALRIYLIQI